MMSLSRWIPLILLIALIVGGLVALSRQNNSAHPSTTPASNQSQSQSSNTEPVAPTADQAIPGGNVKMVNMLFTPSQISVQKGATVTWTNDDTVAHTVVADNGTGPSSGEIAPGSTYSYTFKTTGSYQYHCGIHSSMRGTIVVQ